MHLFISHSRENSSVALLLCNELSSRGVNTWLDLRDLKPGADWDRSVISPIKSVSGCFPVGPPGSSDRWQTLQQQANASTSVNTESWNGS